MSELDKILKVRRKVNRLKKKGIIDLTAFDLDTSKAIQCTPDYFFEHFKEYDVKDVNGKYDEFSAWFRKTKFFCVKEF